MTSSYLAQLAAPPVFVIGHHRSGTTWVYDLLAYPEGVAGVFESWMFTDNLGFGSLLHWGHWGEGQKERVEKLTGTRAGLLQLVDREEVFETCRELAERWLSNALKPTDRYLVEKTPDHLYSTHIINEIFPMARFVNVIRDGRDVAASVRAARSWNPMWMPKTLLSMYRVGQAWRNASDKGRALAREFGPRFFEVSYETLRAAPKQTLTKLYSFCGFDFDEDTVEAALNANALEVRSKGPDDPFRRKGEVGGWKRELRLSDRLLFQLGAGPALVDRGYTSSRWW